MIYYKDDINNDMILREDFVAFIDDDGDIYVIKNRYTGETGKMTNKRYETITAKQHEDNDTEDIFTEIAGVFDYVVGNIDDLIQDSKPVFDDAVNKINELSNSIPNRFESYIEIRELKSLLSTAKRLNVDTKKFTNKILTRINTLEDSLNDA